jgi:hypothetical protein
MASSIAPAMPIAQRAGKISRLKMVDRRIIRRPRRAEGVRMSLRRNDIPQTRRPVAATGCDRAHSARTSPLLLTDWYGTHCRDSQTCKFMASYPATEMFTAGRARQLGVFALIELPCAGRQRRGGARRLSLADGSCRFPLGGDALEHSCAVAAGNRIAVSEIAAYKSFWRAQICTAGNVPNEARGDSWRWEVMP